MEKSKYQFEKLTPVDNADLGVYEAAIDYVFQNQDIKNVALSGAYSAGKSSILESYKKKHSDLEFLHISLAHFDSLEQAEHNNVKEAVLEGKVLNQLIHQIPAEKIPQTNFRIKRKIRAIDIMKRTVLVALCVLSVLHMVYFNQWTDYVVSLPELWLKPWLEVTTHSASLLVSAFVLFVIACIWLYCLIKMQRERNIFRKFTLQGNVIEIFAENEDSYFDKYLNEVLYLFENTGADVIVFEDLDRFHANCIFERLHEINRLANIQLRRENKALLRFFYLLRDDIFDSKERTKFFDYIIPVIPVLDSSNAYDQFIVILERSGMFHKFEPGFLKGLSLYVDDMRLLKNIYNEFVIYYNRLNTIELDCNKMLAILTYKNLFPKDFSDLQLNKGFVYALFQQKDSVMQAEANRLKQSVLEKQQDIRAEQEKEIGCLEDAFNKKRQGILQKLSKSDEAEYLKRKQEIEENATDELRRLKNEETELLYQIVHIRERKLYELITRDNITQIFQVTSVNEIGIQNTFDAVKASPYFDLLKYLIRNGYIDETYADYMTYFYESSLSRNDKIFLRSLMDKKAKVYNYPLENPQLVVSDLELEDFAQEEILNFDLLAYLLDKDSEAPYLVRMLQQLRDTRNFGFVWAYLDWSSSVLTYMECLNFVWPELFSQALEENGISKQKLQKYAVNLIWMCSEKVLQMVNRNQCLTNYISNSPDFFAFNKVYYDGMSSGLVADIIEKLRLLEVRFKSIDYENINKRMFNEVYQCSLYELNAENISLMLKSVYQIADEEAICHQNYTQILKQPDSALARYISENMESYIKLIVQISGGIILDEEGTVLAVLNRADISIETKQVYMEALQTVVTAIESVEKQDLWDLMLNLDCVLYSEENIMAHFLKNGKLEDCLIQFINNGEKILDFSDYEDEKRKAFFWEAGSCNGLMNVKYRQIMSSLNCYYKPFSDFGLSNDKLQILIDYNIVRMDIDTLETVRMHYKEQLSGFIQKRLYEYTEIVTADNFSFSELIEILSWTISDDIKIKLLGCTDKPISIIDKGYSAAVCIYILNNNLKQSDLSQLFRTFEQWEQPVQEVIQDLAVENLDMIKADKKGVSERLITYLEYVGAMRDK